MQRLGNSSSMSRIQSVVRVPELDTVVSPLRPRRPTQSAGYAMVSWFGDDAPCVHASLTSPTAMRPRKLGCSRHRQVSPGEGFGTTTESAAPTLTRVCPLRIRSRPSGRKNASHRAARDGPVDRPCPRRPLRPLGTGRAGRPGPAPRPTRAHPGQLWPKELPDARLGLPRELDVHLRARLEFSRQANDIGAKVKARFAVRRNIALVAMH